VLNSIAKLLTRIVAYGLVAIGAISTNFMEFLVNDPDVNAVLAGAIGIAVVEAGFGIRRYRRFLRIRRIMEKKDEEDSAE